MLVFGLRKKSVFPGSESLVPGRFLAPLRRNVSSTSAAAVRNRDSIVARIRTRAGSTDVVCHGLKDEQWPELRGRAMKEHRPHTSLRLHH